MATFITETEMTKSGNQSKSFNGARMTLMNIWHFPLKNVQRLASSFRCNFNLNELLSLKTFRNINVKVSISIQTMALLVGFTFIHSTAFSLSWRGHLQNWKCNQKWTLYRSVIAAENSDFGVTGKLLAETLVVDGTGYFDRRRIDWFES